MASSMYDELKDLLANEAVNDDDTPVSAVASDEEDELAAVFDIDDRL